MQFLIREAKLDDAPTLLKLAKMVHFINLPADPDIISSKIQRSRRSFANKVDDPRDREFMFVLEDADTGNVVGTSGVISQLSWPGHPHVFFQVRKREHYSEDLQTGAVHVTLQLGTDETGPSEIGGLILSPSYRGHKDKLGSFLSLIRFHFVGLHREWFSEKIIAEMMAPLTPDSRNTLWEYLGRRFINLRYAEADRFCQHSKEFMTSLLPKAELYVSLLPPEARNLIGKVGPETEPAKRLLESLGFEYRGHIDPFDGGPYLDAQVDDIELVTTTRHATFAGATKHAKDKHRAFISSHQDTSFRAIKSPVDYDSKKNEVALPADAIELLQIEPGAELGLTMIPSRKEREKNKPSKRSSEKQLTSSTN